MLIDKTHVILMLNYDLAISKHKLVEMPAIFKYLSLI